MSTTDPMTELLSSSIPGTLPANLTISAVGGPRLDLDGLRVTPPRGGPIYLIMDGVRRWIPNPATYNNLFRDWNGVITDLNVNAIPKGPALLDGAVLFRGDGAPVYLMDVAGKRWVTSPAAMDKYYFNWSKIAVLPGVVVNAVPNGANIS